MDCSPPGSSVHEIFQAAILEWVAISSSRVSSWFRDQTCVSCLGRQILYHWAIWEAHMTVCICQNSGNCTIRRMRDTGFDLCVLQARTMLETFGLLKPCSPSHISMSESQSGPPLCPWKAMWPWASHLPWNCFFSFLLKFLIYIHFFFFFF